MSIYKKVLSVTASVGVGCAAVIAVAGLFTACDGEDEVVRIGAARIEPSLTVDASVVTSSGEVIEVLSVVPSPDDFDLRLESADGSYSHTWPSFTQYPRNEILRPGQYSLYASCGSALKEGRGCPWLSGNAGLTLSGGDETPVTVTATLSSAVFDMTFDAGLDSRFAEMKAVIHSSECSYVEYGSCETGYVYLTPGQTSVALDVRTVKGQHAVLSLGCITETRSAHLYDIAFSQAPESATEIVATVNGAEIGRIDVTEDLLDAASPVMTTSGFRNSVPVTIVEGEAASAPLQFIMDGSEPESLVLTTQAPELTARGWPSEIDLFKTSDEEKALLRDMGLKFGNNDTGGVYAVDFTDVVACLRYNPASADRVFSLVATGRNGKMSDVGTLLVNVKPVDIKVLSMSDMIIGAEVAEVMLICHSGNLRRNVTVESLDADGIWKSCDIVTIDERGENEYSVRFRAPASTAGSITVRIKYMGNVAGTAVIKRVAPDYSVSIDPFALSAVVKVTAENQSVVPLITSMLRIYVDNSYMATDNRDVNQGIVRVGPLESNKTYRLCTTLIDNPSESDFTPWQTFRTESILQVKNSNFEDHEDGIKYAGMPSGGRYSQSIADVFNCQNHRSFDVQRPRDWASTNDKTFCKAASNINTWYLAPSAMSEVDNVEGYFAVRLQSVAWDISGEQIADYRQQAGQFLAYNPNVPHIKYRAAGKLFLGKYKFDPLTLAETYTEGISFTSRPVALNGNYRFTPSMADLNDCGYVRVEVTGEKNGVTIVLARGEAYLRTALTYTAFNVPLTYNHFGVKATRLKIMLSSSRYVGSIEYETSHIKTFNDPVTASSTGGSLWVEDITLSYF